jgi:hypothetical protein
VREFHCRVPERSDSAEFFARKFPFSLGREKVPVLPGFRFPAGQRMIPATREQHVGQEDNPCKSSQVYCRGNDDLRTLYDL